jgi:lipopolysaccharide/colanic/teichoic acid biosynthesis glycosyltransferase
MDFSLPVTGRWQVQRAVKRWMDVCAGAAALILLSPLLLAISLLLALDSPRQIFYRQARIGLDGRPFMLYKFRTMRAGSEESFQELLRRDPALRLEYAERQKLARDPRLTRLGRYLRRTSLDELPQLWNVLRGEMSLVGPRPFLPEQVSLYGPAIRFYVRVQPGLTGLWQVSGRNELSFEERVGCDLSYLAHWSIWLDLAILLRTPWVVFTQRGAY